MPPGSSGSKLPVSLLMHDVLMPVVAYGMGFLAAMPFGATQVEIARRSLNGYHSAALAVVAGSVLSDAMYGMIAFFGVAPFLQSPLVESFFWAANALVLAALGVLAIRLGPGKNGPERANRQFLRAHHVAFFTGFSLAVTNPLMMFWWLLGARLLGEAGLIHQLGVSQKLLLLSSGSLGIGSYLSVFALGLLRAKNLLSEDRIGHITWAFGFVLLGLAVYSAAKVAGSLLPADAMKALPALWIGITTNPGLW